MGGRRFTDAQVKFIQVSNTTAIERRDPQHYWNTVGVGTIAINGSVLGWANGWEVGVNQNHSGWGAAQLWISDGSESIGTTSPASATYRLSTPLPPAKGACTLTYPNNYYANHDVLVHIADFAKVCTFSSTRWLKPVP